MPSKYDSPCGIDFCSVDILESLLNARVSANAAHQALTRAFNKFEEPELRGRRGMGVKEAEMQAQYVKAADRIEKLLEKVDRLSAYLERTITVVRVLPRPGSK